jgi:hypothetical protein
VLVISEKKNPAIFVGSGIQGFGYESGTITGSGFYLYKNQ